MPRMLGSVTGVASRLEGEREGGFHRQGQWLCPLLLAIFAAKCTSCCVVLIARLQPKRTIMDVVCRVCSMVNDWQARFCSSCKLLMEPSIRPSHVEHSSRWKVG